MPDAPISQEEAIGRLLEAEAGFPVCGCVLDGIHLWPLVRKRLWFQLTAARPQHGGTSVLGKVRTLARFLRAGARHAFAPAKVRWSGVPSPRARALFVVAGKRDLVTVEGRDVDVRCDPYMTAFEAASVACAKVHVTELGHDGGSRTSTRLDLSWLRLLPCGGPDLVSVSPRLEQLAGLKLGQFLRLVGWWRRWLASVEPDLLLCSCYYSDEVLPAVVAANALGIPTIDIQHGKQGRFQGMYNHWTVAPQEGFKVLPSRFWVWGRPSAAHFDSNAFSGVHLPVVGGNCWIQSWMSRQGSGSGTLPAALLQLIEGASLVVLVSLQHDGRIPKVVEEAMRTSSRQTRWLIRAHPVVSHAGRGAIEARAEELAAGRVEVTLASSLPLLELLTLCTHHVTGWSSVGYEALVLGVPTVFVAEQAATLYKDYIDRQHFAFAATATDLVRALERALEDWDLKEQTPYIETDPSVTSRAIEQLLQLAGKSDP